MNPAGSMKILHVVGARPNLMRIGPVMRALEGREGVQQFVIHTGGREPAPPLRTSGELELPVPDIVLGAATGAGAARIGRILIALEPLIDRHRPDWVVTAGEVDSALAAALVAAKLGAPLAHIEAGLRWGDLTRPEEVNRILTDRVSRALFTTEASAGANLAHEGIPPGQVHFTGSVVIDALDRCIEAARGLEMPGRMGLAPGSFVLAALQSPRNTCVRERLQGLLEGLAMVAAECACEVVLPLQAGAAACVRRFGLERLLRPLILTEPLTHSEFVGLLDAAGAVVTDSGPIQEETTVLGVATVTPDSKTDRPVTVAEGTNRLFDGDPGDLAEIVAECLASGRTPRRPALWDGHAGERIADAVLAAPGRRSAAGAA